MVRKTIFGDASRIGPIVIGLHHEYRNGWTTCTYSPSVKELKPNGIIRKIPVRTSNWFKCINFNLRHPNNLYISNHSDPILKTFIPKINNNLVKIHLNSPRSFIPFIPTLLVCNIRSIAPKIDELECVVNQNGADVICVTETWLSNEIPDNAVSLRDFILCFVKIPNARGLPSMIPQIL